MIRKSLTFIFILLLVASPVASQRNNLFTQSNPELQRSEQAPDSVGNRYLQNENTFEEQSRSSEGDFGPISFTESVKQIQPSEMEQVTTEASYIVEWREVSEDLTGIFRGSYQQDFLVKVADKRLEVGVKFSAYGNSPDLM